MSHTESKTFAFRVRSPADGAMQCLLSPLSPQQAQMAGGLRAEAIIGQVKDEAAGFVPSNFLPNPSFLRFLHWVIAKHASACSGLVAEAKRQMSGYVYVLDLRTSNPNGAVPPEDVIGAFEVSKGEMTLYRSSPKYQVVGNNGIMQLHPWFHDKLIEELIALAEQRPAT